MKLALVIILAGAFSACLGQHSKWAYEGEEGNAFSADRWRWSTSLFGQQVRSTGRNNSNNAASTNNRPSTSKRRECKSRISPFCSCIITTRYEWPMYQITDTRVRTCSHHLNN